MRYSAALKAVGALIIASTTAQADVDVNSSYLADLKYSSNHDYPVLDSKRELQLAQQYDDMSRAYMCKRTYGTASLNDELVYNAAVTAYAKSIVDEVQAYQFGIQKDKVASNLRRDPNLAALERAGKYPAAVAGGAWSLYNGTTYTLRSGNVAFTPGASIKNKSGSIAVSSPILTASFAASLQNFTTSVSRALVDHVSVSFSNTIQPDVPSANTISFNYGLSL